MTKTTTLIAIILPVMIVSVLGFLLVQRDHHPVAISTGLLSLFIIFQLYLFLGLSPLLEKLQTKVASHRAFLWAIPLPLGIAYLIYYFGTGENQLHHLGTALGYYWLPALILWIGRPKSQSLTVWDIAIILAIWIPIDAKLVQSSWFWPEGQGAAAFVNSSATILCVLMFVAGRGLRDVGFRFTLRKSDLKPMFQNLNWASLTIIPLGFVIGFLSWSPMNLTPQHMIGTFIGVMFMVAIPEEMFFRGVIQNFLEKSMTNQTLAMVISAIIFGLSHANNEAYPGGPIPDWRFVVFSTVAGIFYSRTYKACGGIFPAAVIHTIMDTVWFHLFRG